jgi:hypothetical protein
MELGDDGGATRAQLRGEARERALVLKAIELNQPIAEPGFGVSGGPEDTEAFGDLDDGQPWPRIARCHRVGCGAENVLVGVLGCCAAGGGLCVGCVAATGGDALDDGPESPWGLCGNPDCKTALCGIPRGQPIVHCGAQIACHGPHHCSWLCRPCARKAIHAPDGGLAHARLERSQCLYGMECVVCGGVHSEGLARQRQRGWNRASRLPQVCRRTRCSGRRYRCRDGPADDEASVRTRFRMIRSHEWRSRSQ